MEFAPHIDTDRLLLRPIRLRDFGFFYRLVGNKDVRRYLGGPVPLRARFERFLNYCIGVPNSVIWIVRARDNDELIGIVELGPYHDAKDYEVSFQFCPKHWGNGFAREAVAAVLRMGFADTGLKRIISETQVANVASCRLLAGLGMSECARVHRFGAAQIVFEKTAKA
jgi:ribosomal-protein-alanine N-acetyltransferase